MPIGAPEALINTPALGRSVASVATLSNGVSSIIRSPTPGRTEYLGANVTEDWATEPYKIRLLADAVESFLFLFTPAVIGAVGRGWPLAPNVLHSQRLAAPAGRGTAPNWDTVYSLTRVELSLAPHELRVPPLKDRFYSVVVYDVYQNVILSLGSAQHLTDGINILLVGPSSPREPVDAYKRWQASLGSKTLGGGPYTEIVQVPTDLAIVLLRPLILNPSYDLDPVVDGAAIKAFQAGVSVKPYRTTIDVNTSRAAFPPAPGGVQGLLAPNADPATWYGWAASIVAQYPAPPSTLSEPLSGKLKRLGLLDPAFNFSALDTDVQQALTWAIPIGHRFLDAGILYNFEYEFSSWQVSTRNWGVYGHDYFTNAVVTKAFYLPNTGVDAAYAVAYWDAAGEPLNGSGGARYEWTIPAGKLPCDVASTGWWSFIVYDQQNTLVENPLQRYGVNDRTKGLVYGPNGDLTFYLQITAPSDPVEYANWVPVPSGAFTAVLRLYNPTQDFLDGKVELEPLLKRPPPPPAPAPPSLTPQPPSPAPTYPPSYAGSYP